jgi:hypothetical protein
MTTVPSQALAGENRYCFITAVLLYWDRFLLNL